MTRFNGNTALENMQVYLVTFTRLQKPQVCVERKEPRENDF